MAFLQLLGPVCVLLMIGAIVFAVVMRHEK
jgi:hypothetical protein